MQDIRDSLLSGGDQFRLLVESVQDYAIFMLDPNGIVVTWNSGAERIKGYAAGEIIGNHFSAFYSPEDRAADRPRASLEIATTKGRYAEEGRRVRKDGSQFWAGVVITALRDDSGRLLGFAKVTRDLTERKAAEDELRAGHQALEEKVRERTAELTELHESVRRSEARYRTIINAISAVVWTWRSADEDYESTPPWHEYTGCSAAEVRGWNWIKPLHPDDREDAAARFRAAIEARRPFHAECRLGRSDGEYRHVSLHGFPLKDEDGQIREWVGICLDRNDQKNLEEQLRQAQKMEAVGQLAGGVAHDFNNLLTIISGYSEILHESTPRLDPRQSAIRAIIDAGERAAGLTRQLLSFSRRAVVETQIVDLNSVVEKTESMLRRLIGEDVVLRTILDPHAGRIKADPGQIGQVLVNLAVNARDALPRGGRLLIETKNVQLDEPYINTHVEVERGRYVLLTVSDNGLGMTPDVRTRVFEPFFTTKPVGKGSGLGLSVVHGIVKHSNGHIGAYSEPGIGTTFKIYLPSVDELPTDAVAAPPASLEQTGTETILLVEDEAGVREMAALCLRMRGYHVIAAGDGAEARQLVIALDGRIDILVTDVVMPEMSGRQLAEALAPRYPQMKVLYLSGYTDDAVVRHGILEADVAFLAKPYTPQVLLRKVRQVLDERGVADRAAGLSM